MELKGDRIKINILKVEDVFFMREWGIHETPLLEDYNFPEMDDKEIKIWYKMKTRSPFNEYYAIRNEDEKLIGYMGIKHIKKFKRKSTLGIVLDPNQVNKGYGTEILEVFLNYYFTEMKMKKMILEVSAFNKRAYRLYEKLGFVKKGYHLDEFCNPYINKEDPYFLEEKSAFVIDEEKIYNYVYRMTLTKKIFFKTRKNP